MEKNRVLLVVDLQPEFRDTDGRYEEILQFVKNCCGYDKVIATVCGNSEKSPFVKYNNWFECMGSHEPLEFEADDFVYKEGYGLADYDVLPKDSFYEIIGFNTDACVLKVALDLFDRGYDFCVLTEQCYSSNGAEHHARGVRLMRELMSDAIK